MKTDIFPQAKDVMNMLDNIMLIIGYKPNNGKGWTGYYNVSNQEKRWFNLSWTDARTLACYTQSYRILWSYGIELTHKQKSELKEYIRLNSKFYMPERLVYHKKKRMVTLEGYNGFDV